jgi:hypothetical protein
MIPYIVTSFLSIYLIFIRVYTLSVYNSTGLYNQTSGTTNGFVQLIGVVVNLVDGAYEWFFSLFDTVGNQGISENSTITIDTVQPAVRIIYPMHPGFTYFNATSLNFTTTGTICSYSLNGAANQSIPCTQNVSNIFYPDGNNTITLYAKDNANNINSTTISFIQDTISPIIYFDNWAAGNETQPTNTYFPFNYIPITVTVIEANINEFVILNIYDYTEKITAASDSSFKFKVVDFVWPYRNSWDKYSETVIVKIVFTFNDAAVMVKCSLKSENDDVMEYNGFVRGSINRDVWKE